MTLVQTPLQETGVGRSRRWLPAALKRRQRRDRGPERSAPAPPQARAARGRSLLAALRPCRRRRAGVITLHVGVRRSPFSVSLGRPSWYVTARGGNACPSPHRGPFAVQVTLRARGRAHPRASPEARRGGARAIPARAPSEEVAAVGPPTGHAGASSLLRGPAPLGAVGPLTCRLMGVTWPVPVAVSTRLWCPARVACAFVRRSGRPPTSCPFLSLGHFLAASDLCVYRIVPLTMQ